MSILDDECTLLDDDNVFHLTPKKDDYVEWGLAWEDVFKDIIIFYENDQDKLSIEMYKALHLLKNNYWPYYIDLNLDIIDMDMDLHQHKVIYDVISMYISYCVLYFDTKDKSHLIIYDKHKIKYLMTAVIPNYRIIINYRNFQYSPDIREDLVIYYFNAIKHHIKKDLN